MARSASRRAARKGRKTQSDALDPSGVIWRPTEGPSKYLNHKFRTQGTIYAISGSGITQFGGGWIQLDGLPNYTAFTNLYDAYRIDYVEATFQLNGLTGTSAQFPRLTVYPDFDDGANPTSLANAQSHPRAAIVALTPTRPVHKMTFQPRVAMSVYKGAFSGYASPKDPVFVDSATPDVRHYGFKYAVENLALGQSIDVIYRVWLTCRNPL